MPIKIKNRSLVIGGLSLIVLILFAVGFFIWWQFGKSSSPPPPPPPPPIQQQSNASSSQPIMSDRAEDFTISGTNIYPRFTKKLFIDPFYNAKPGETLNFSIWAEDPKGVKEVIANITTTKGQEKIPLSLTEGSSRLGKWQGQWVVKNVVPGNTPDIVFTAENKDGKTTNLNAYFHVALQKQSWLLRKSFGFLKPQQVLAANGWIAWAIAHKGNMMISSNFYIPQGKKVGIEAGDLIVRSKHGLVLERNAVLVFNQGRRIKLEPGSYILLSGQNAKIIKGHVSISSCKGFLSCYSSTPNSVTLHYTFIQCGPTSLFAEGVGKSYSLGTGTRNGLWEFKGLQSNKTYKFYLTNHIAEATCSTKSGAVSPPCTNECYLGQKACCGSWGYKTCQKVNNNCNKWGSCVSCGTDRCIGTTWRDYYCTGNGTCTYRDFYNELKCIKNDPVSGTLSASASSVYVGQNYTITISGHDNDGLRGAYLWYDGQWHWHGLSGKARSTSWTFSKSSPGTYTYYGKIYGYTPTKATENAKTNPYSLKVTIKVKPYVPSCSASLSCHSSTQNSITLAYSFSHCGAMRLYRGNSYVAYLGSGSKPQSVYTVKNLSPGKSYTFYLKENSTIKRSATCSTQQQSQPAPSANSINLPPCPFNDTPGVWANPDIGWSQPAVGGGYTRCRIGTSCSKETNEVFSKHINTSSNKFISAGPAWSRKTQFCKIGNSGNNVPKCPFSGGVKGSLYITSTDSWWNGWSTNINDWCQLTSSGGCSKAKTNWLIGSENIRTYSNYSGECFHSSFGGLTTGRECYICIVR